MQKARDVYLIQRKTTMQAARALGYSPVRKEEKVFKEIEKILSRFLLDGVVLGSVVVQVTLKLNEKSVAHIDLRSASGEDTRITNAMINQGFYNIIEKPLTEHRPEYGRVCDFSSPAAGLWDLD